MKLVVTADDLGLSPAVTRGILEAYRRGVVRSASLLVTFAGAEEAAACARDEAGLEIGLHLDFVGGEPAAGATAVRSLVDEDGRFHALREFALRLCSGRIRAADLARETRAQVARARSWGIEPLAWDSHRHTHLMPPVARVVGAIARQENVRWIRRGSLPALSLAPKALAVAASSFAAAPFFRGIPGNDWYVDLSSCRPPLDPTGLALLAVRPGVGELGAHPGYIDDALLARDPLVARRAHDLALLTDPVAVTGLGRLVGRRAS